MGDSKYVVEVLLRGRGVHGTVGIFLVAGTCIGTLMDFRVWCSMEAHLGWRMSWQRRTERAFESISILEVAELQMYSLS